MTTKMEKKMIGAFYRLTEENIELKAENERLKTVIAIRDKNIEQLHRSQIINDGR